MELTVFLAVLAAAALHAGWNAVVKVGQDRFAAILLMSLTQSGLALLLIPFLPLPAQAAWPWIPAAALLHTGYKLFLVRAYQHGDYSQVYPIARGTAPLIVALAGALLLGEHLALGAVAAIAAIGGGVVLMASGSKAVKRLPAAALAYALGTAAFTASYTLADAHGARLAATASGFTLWIFALDGAAMLAYALATRGRAAMPALRPHWQAGLVAGAMSLASYWIVIWAFTRAPVALVAALRETSVVFAVVIAVVVLRERPGVVRLAAVGLIALGVAAMRLWV